MGKWGSEEMGKWGNGKMGKWGNGEMGKWESGEMGKWGNGKNKKGSVITHGTFFNIVDVLWLMVKSEALTIKLPHYQTIKLSNYLTTKRVERISVPLVRLII